MLFLRRVVEEPASRSYGIEVARLAGLPAAWSRARARFSTTWSSGEFDETGIARLALSAERRAAAHRWVCSRRPSSRAIDELRALEVDRLTPVEALNTLARLVGRARDRE